MNHCQLLFPFWGEVHQHDGYSEFAREGRQFLGLTALQEADVALLPFDGNALINVKDGSNREIVSLAARFIDTARAANRKTIVLINADSEEPLPFSDVLVFRTSLNRRTRKSNDFALPAWHEDLVSNYLGGEIALRDHGDRPVVGFCGHASSARPRFRRRVKNLLREAIRPVGLHIPHNDGVDLRQIAMEALNADPALETNFILRKGYFGGGLDNDRSEKDRRLDFVSNLVQSDYALCVRGYGNFSFRFFEAMSLGRIPLLIDTDCVLPYEFLHDYREYCAIVPDARLKQCGKSIARFHNSIPLDSYHELQRRIRHFWLNWLSPQGFFRNLRHHWESQKVERASIALRQEASTNGFRTAPAVQVPAGG
jgi:hypothetical protein